MRVGHDKFQEHIPIIYPMRKLYSQRSYRIICSFILAVFLFQFQGLMAQDEAVSAGKKLFNTNCASCHKLDKKLVGPALGDVTQRRSEEWLIAWIKDNVALRASGDKDAIAIYEEYNGSPMSAFPQLSDEDVKNILAYTAYVPEGTVPTPGTQVVEAAPKKDNSLLILLGLFAFLILLLFLLVKVKNTLKLVKGQPATSLAQDTRYWGGIMLRNKKVVTLIIIVLLIFGARDTWNGMMALGVDQGYQPEQPIAFSHKIHAGDNAIDCNYCHSGARKSKAAGIPSANVCMNCHTYIQEGTLTGTEEISKIYAAVGFNPETGSYIEDYQQKPIRWVRIHKLPDLAYFNHSQHVIAGQVECQECHGPIQEMEEVYQHSELTMGWCVECHRNTEVKMEGNAYYDELHKQLSEKYHGEKITVDKIGGLECGKCHY